MKLLREYIRTLMEGASPDEIHKIEELWWNKHEVEDSHTGYRSLEFPQRAMALSMIDAFNLNPHDLRIWQLVQGNSGEIYNESGPGLTISEVKQIVEEYNNSPNITYPGILSKAQIDRRPPSPNAYAQVKFKAVAFDADLFDNDDYLLYQLMTSISGNKS